MSQAISKLQTEKLMGKEVLSWISYSITDAHSSIDKIFYFDWKVLNLSQAISKFIENERGPLISP